MPARFNHALPTLVAMLALTQSAIPVGAQTGDDPNEGLTLQLASDVAGAYSAKWWGHTGRTYFLQRSTDLATPWEYFPLIETGADAPLSYGFVNDAPRVFVRLRILEQTYSDPYTVDSDGDGLTNQQEFTLRTDPFSTDTDGDDLPDGWEFIHGLNPRDPADSLTDPDGDGRSTAQEYLEGTDPLTNDDAPPYTGSMPTPTGLTIEELGTSTIRLLWVSNLSIPIRGYLVERSSDYITWALIGFTVGNTTTYDDTSAQPGVAYAYRVAGVY